MQNFNFYIPTKIIFGSGEIKKLRDNLYNDFNTILIVTDKIVSRESGALEAVAGQFEEHEIIIFDEVEENPSFNTLEKGRKIAKERCSEIVIAIGGGSPMDAAKGIAVLSSNEGNMKEYMQGKILQKDPLPVICIPTTSGTGSEVTPYAVFTDPDNQTKGGYANPKIFPLLSIVDPELTYSMPENVVINTGLDALTHSIEAYLSTEAFPMSDMVALESIQVILKNLEKASLKNEEAMAEVAYASMLGGIAITHGGTILLHIMGYPLTVFHKIPHGRANALLLPEFMNFMKNNSTVKDKVCILNQMFRMYGGIEVFINNLGVSTRLSDYGIQENEIDTFVQKSIVKGDVKITPAEITKQSIADIYLKAL